jgi:acetylglutamate kinase
MKKPPLSIIKIGGQIVEDEQKLKSVLAQFAKIKGAKILVHGGGKAASAWSKKLGIIPQMIEGRRVTDAATLEIVTMVYAGLYNKKIVSWLQAISCNALGLTGADLNSIQSHKRIVKTFDYGFAGDIDLVETSILKQLLNNHVTPVFCAITHDKKGQLLNTNADTIASELAVAFAPFYETTLKFCFEKNGVLENPEDNHSVFSKISFTDYQKYKQVGIISEGMIPKMDNAFFALKNQVDKVFICGAKEIHQANGTSIQL